MTDSTLTGIRFGLAKAEHIPYLQEIQSRFHKKAEKNELRIDYEVSADPFTREDFQKIIELGQCVIVASAERPEGFILIDSCSSTQGLQDYQKNLGRLVQEGFIADSIKNLGRYAETMNPELLSEDFEDLRWQMLLTLVRMNKEKLDGLCFPFFTNVNTLIDKMHLGWKIAFDNNLYYFLTWEFSQLNAE